MHARRSRPLRSGRSPRARQPRRVDVGRADEGALSLRAAQLVALRPERVRGRRAHHVDRANEARCAVNACVLVHHARGRRRLAHAIARCAATPRWQYLGGPLGINAAGAVTIDPQRPESAGRSTSAPARRTSARSGCVAGVGLYKSTNGGQTWTGPIGKPEFQGKGIGEIIVKPGDPNTLYVAYDDRAPRLRPRSAARASRAPCRAPRSGGCTSRRTAARRGASSTTAPRRRPPAPGR